MPEYHISDIKRFKSCRQAWDYSSPLRMNLAPKRTPLHFVLGKGVHYACSALYETGEKPSEAYERYISYYKEKEGHLWGPKTLDTIKLGHAMCETYYSWVTGSDAPDALWKVLATEIRFGPVKLPIPGTTRLSTKYALTGRFDQVIENRLTGALWIREFKTSARAPVMNWLDNDDQLTAYCVPLDSEILTRNGWKKYDELVVGEEVLGYNGETNLLEWTNLESFRIYNSKPVIHYNGRSFSFMCTPDHKWALRRPEWSTYSKKYSLEPIRPGLQQTYIVMSAPLDSPTLGITPDEAACVAWILTDGTHIEYSNALHAAIYQKKYIEEVETLLQRLGGDSVYSSVHSNSGTLCWNLRAPFVRALFEKAGLGLDLNGWEPFILGMSIEARTAFCNAAMLAEGSNNNSFYQNFGTKHDLFKLAFFLCGYYPTESKPTSGRCGYFTVSEGRRWTRVVKSVDLGEKVDVWCPQTSLRTWVMRQNGQIVITGNSWAIQQILGKPVEGVQYRFLMKSAPVKPELVQKGARLSKAIHSSLKTTYDLYKQAIEENHFNTADYADVLGELEGLGWGEYIIEYPSMRSQEALRVAAENLFLTVWDMDHNPTVYPSPDWIKCAWCSHLEPCIALREGREDLSQQLLESEFAVQVREKTEDIDLYARIDVDGLEQEVIDYDES